MLEIFGAKNDVQIVSSLTMWNQEATPCSLRPLLPLFLREARLYSGLIPFPMGAQISLVFMQHVRSLLGRSGVCKSDRCGYSLLSDSHSRH